jgi:3-deoxy-manno-octulosonate cytidylyltransferase (CMP-KDO synthetase)
MRKIIAIIPARMGSTRFPGKPLTKICGKSMIEHVYKRTAMTSVLDEVFVATCDKEIWEEVVNFGGRVVMTSPKHERCTERIAEAARQIDADIIINVQGDEPMVTPDIIELSLKPFLDNNVVYCTNLIRRIQSRSEFYDKNTIKVVVNKNMDVLYFSREPIPTNSLGKKAGDWYKQLGIMAFTKEFLIKYPKLEPTSLEIAESIDMNRILEHGYSIKAVLSEYESFGVDTVEDRDRVEILMKDDPLCGYY